MEKTFNAQAVSESQAEMAAKLMRLGINVEGIMKILPMLDPNASTITREEIAKLCDQIYEELNFQAIESTISSSKVDLDDLSVAVERIQKDIQAKKLEQKFEEENKKLFRTTGSALVWRPVFLYNKGLINGGIGRGNSWKQDIAKAINDALVSDESYKTMAARLSMKLTEARITCSADPALAGKAIMPMLTDITCIAKDILNIEKETSVNGYTQLRQVIDTIDAWVGINF